MDKLCLVLLALLLFGCPSKDHSGQPRMSDSGNELRPNEDASVRSSEYGGETHRDSLLLIVDLDDNSRTIGTVRLTTVAIATPYANLDLPLELIVSVEFADQGGGVALQMRNGDKLQGVLKLDTLELSTKLGMVSIPAGIIRNISIRTMRGVADAGLLAFYPFDGDARDASGNANHGILHGATLAADRLGRPGAAYQFDGSSDYIVIPNGSNLQFQSQITLCGWVYPNGFYQGHCLANDIVRRGEEDQTKGNFFLRYGVDCGDNFLPERERFSFGVNLNGFAGTEPAEGTTIVRPGVWYFVAGTYDGRAFRLYVNGVLEGVARVSGAIANNAADLTIGGNANPLFPYRVNGVLDDIRIYDRALSESDILELYHRK